MTAGVARSLLFVPADRPERFAKATGAGAGLVVLDLEDGVAPAKKDVARAAAAAGLRSGIVSCVRINAAGTVAHHQDLDALAGMRCTIMLPKAESPEVADEAAARLAPGSNIIALIETAAGLLAAPKVAASTSVVRLAFGSLDYAAELGVSPDDPEAVLAARAGIVIASAAGGIAPPVDGVTAQFNNTELLVADLDRARRLGFRGKLCIHPSQVRAVERAFAPTAEELRWAQRVRDTAVQSDGGPVQVDGAMIDKPVVARAIRILGGTES